MKQMSSSSAEEYRQKSELLINKMNALMLDKADIEKLVGKENLDMMKDNHANHVRFMASVFKNYNPEVLVETVLWVFRAYRSHGFTTNYWATQLNTWISLLKEMLTPESFSEIYPYYEWMQINIPVFTKLSDEKLELSQSVH
ncbi:MAG: hypothetical protein PHX49_05630 [Bacteroidales bacterium]|nr:hypothetical protein [Bacteroidales bacterium]